MAFHESGHVIATLVNSGRIDKVVLHPFQFSQTIATGSHRPLVDVWMGPAAGTALPFFLYLMILRVFPAVRYYFGYLAGFCAVANGVYIGVSWAAAGHGDAHELLRLGVSRVYLVAAGFLLVAIGLYVWHRELRHYRQG